MLLIKNDVDILHECGFLKNDIINFSRELKKLNEQNEEYPHYIKKRINSRKKLLIN